MKVDNSELRRVLSFLLELRKQFGFFFDFGVFAGETHLATNRLRE